MDGLLRKFGARTFPNGEVVFIIYCRMPGSRMPTRRKLGRFPEMSLDDARTKAEQWILKIRHGIDPSLELAREAQANIELERRRSANSFTVALGDYYRHKSDEGLRSIDARKVAMNRELAPWMTLSLQDITEDVIRALVDGIKKRGHPAQALVTLAAHKEFLFVDMRARRIRTQGEGQSDLGHRHQGRRWHNQNERAASFERRNRCIPARGHRASLPDRPLPQTPC